MSPFLAWGDFHARSRFARYTIPEEKLGLLVVYAMGGEGWIPHKNHWDAFLEAYGFELQFWVSGQKADIFMHTDLALGGIQKNIITFRHTE